MQRWQQPQQQPTELQRKYKISGKLPRRQQRASVRLYGKHGCCCRSSQGLNSGPPVVHSVYVLITQLHSLARYVRLGYQLLVITLIFFCPLLFSVGLSLSLSFSFFLSFFLSFLFFFFWGCSFGVWVFWVGCVELFFGELVSWVRLFWGCHQMCHFYQEKNILRKEFFHFSIPWVVG